MFNVVSQLLVSVTVTEYVPATNPEIVEVVAPVDHRYVNTPLPPEAVTEAVPFASPKHNGSVPKIEAVKRAGSTNVIDNVVSQLLVSVTVTEYVPATNPEIELVVAPVDHKYVNTPLPPEAVTLAVPLASPKHNGSVPAMVATS